MGQTWNEFKRQCGLVIRTFGYRRPQIVTEPLTEKSLRELSLQLFKENYFPKKDDDSSQWSLLLVELASANVWTVIDVVSLVRRQGKTIRKEDREMAALYAEPQSSSGLHLLPQDARAVRQRQLESGHYFSAVGMVRKCRNRHMRLRER